MQKISVIVVSILVFFFISSALANSDVALDENNGVMVKEINGAVPMLTSLMELQLNTKEQIKLSQKKLKESKSEAEKLILQAEIAQLDRQLSENDSDFERIATGVEAALFAEKKSEVFSWQKELGSLIEPAIKELKRFTVRTRQKSELKDKIVNLRELNKTARKAVAHLDAVLSQSDDKMVKREIRLLQPEWRNVAKRLQNKLELAERKLNQLESQDVSLVESSSNSLKTFFKNRGLYLIMALGVFLLILLSCRLTYRVLVAISLRLSKKKDRTSFKVRLLNIIFQVLSVLLAVIGLFFVLYLAEDWFLLSMSIIFFIGLSWTIRQGLPRLWQQGRLMLNIGSVREGERLTLHGIPWRVETINVFCQLTNPFLNETIRIPIEDLIGLVSRPYAMDEPWFPCKKGDWVVINEGSRARVVSLSHEQVEVVERGGRRIIYPTETFLQSCPANLSRNFRIRVPFGLSYELQEISTSKIPEVLKEHLEQRLIDEGYKEKCLNLQVEFFQANSSSLDMLVLADFDGNVADIYKRLERAIQKWCVECCTINNWDIPFPQLTVHRVARN
jgi:small-conductance mechanosensitive channel